MQQFKQKKPLKTHIKIKILGHSPSIRTKKIVLRTTQELGLKPQSIISFKKKSGSAITLLSSPHVHKKSRDQYKIEKNAVGFTFNINNDQDRLRFIKLKNILNAFGYNMMLARCITYMYSKCEQYHLPVKCNNNE